MPTTAEMERTCFLLMNVWNSPTNHKDPSPALRLRGYLHDTIADVGDFNFGYDLYEILDLLAKIPHLYNNDILACADK